MLKKSYETFGEKGLGDCIVKAKHMSSMVPMYGGGKQAAGT